MRSQFSSLLLIAVLGGLPSEVAGEEADHFAIHVVDAATNRGVPLVELETIQHVKFVTDSNGWAVISEPDLLGRKVFFHVRSHGYEFPKDGFGFRGQSLSVERGKQVTLKLKRINLAERLYRITGSGIYRDTILHGGNAPLKKPLINGDVIGCDSVMAAVYRGKIHWYLGDTNRPHYPLGGSFHITGATSALPKLGGLSPDQGVQLNYFVGPDNAVRDLAKMPGNGPTWISALTVLKDANDKQQLYAGYVKIRNQLEAYRWGFVVWDEKTEWFQQVTSFDEKPPIFPGPQTHTFRRQESDGTEYIYFTNPLPLTRVPANSKAFLNPQKYEGFTCLKENTVPKDRQMDRSPDGQLRYSWKANTPPLSGKDQTRLVKVGALKPEEVLFALRDRNTGRTIQTHNGSVYWNEHRKRWVLIMGEMFGESSVLGEVWFAEADKPTGPWGFARKIVTHNTYSFYNPKQHPFFDEANGRVIYFEGTYTTSFSGNPQPTPRYDYNQIMYRLDLSNPAFNLPVAFYRVSKPDKLPPFQTKQTQASIAFFTLEKPLPNTVPVVWKENKLQIETLENKKAALFYAYPADKKSPSPLTIPLYEYVHGESNQRFYTINPTWSKPGYQRTPKPICLVWKIAMHNVEK